MRDNPMAWDEEEGPDGVLSPFGEDDPLNDKSETLRLLGLPTETNIKRPDQVTTSEDTSPAVYAVLQEISKALTVAIADNKGSRIELDHLSEAERVQLFDALGEGEVLIVLSGGVDGEADARIQETVLAGVWRGEASSSDGSVTTYWIETADAPRAVRRASAERSTLQLDIASIEPPRGAMNVMGVLSEIEAKSAEWRPEQENHVLNFTLFPMTPADSAFLSQTLSEVGIQIISGGYGIARVIKTAVPHVWAVQFLNGMGTTILDTIEIGDLPGSVLASREDFEDSATRLAEISGAYAS